MILTRRRKPRRGPLVDLDFRRFVRTFACVACFRELLRETDILRWWQLSIINPTECAHVGRRGLGQKCSDHECLPLCRKHHRTGPTSHHVLGKRFWAYHGLDRVGLIMQLQGIYQRDRGLLSAPEANSGRFGGTHG
jgi:hypothetical protein